MGFPKHIDTISMGWSILSSTLFVGKKDEKIQYLKKYIYNLTPLGIYNGPFHVYCIKLEGRIHQYTKG